MKTLLNYLQDHRKKKNKNLRETKAFKEEVEMKDFREEEAEVELREVEVEEEEMTSEIKSSFDCEL
jgi:hypothetical protein